MRKLAAILCLAFACLSARAAYTTVSLTVTNTPTNGYTVTINGNVRTWTNTVSNAGTQIQNTNSIGACATNLFNQLLSSPIASVQVHSLGTNAVTFSSLSALTVTVSTNWATLVNTSITTTNGTDVIVPFTQYQPATAVTVASQLVSGLENSTTALAASSPVLTNHMALSTAQIVTGAKTFNGAVTLSNANLFITGGGASNIGLTNITALSGTLGNLTNGTFTNPVLTNGVNYGNPFRSPGPANLSEQFGTLAVASGDFSVAFGVGAKASGAGSVALGDAAIASYGSTVAVGFAAIATQLSAIAIGENTKASNQFSIAIGDSTVATNDYSIALGASATTTTDHQIRFGTSSEYVSIPGNAQIVGNITNVHQVGVNTVDGQVSYLRKNITTLVNGSPNLVPTSTNLFLKLSGPTGAFTVNAMDNGTDGRMVILYNITGQTMTIANNSGALGVAANRILTGTGADVVGVYAATFIYDSAQSLWVMISKN